MSEQRLKFAAIALQAGNLAACEIVCRDIVEAAPDNWAALNMLGIVAAKVGAREHAAACFAAARRAAPTNAEIRRNSELLAQSPRPPKQQSSGDRYLLIKSWGYGFWSDVSALLGALLLAEITGRIPVVHWGANSLFGDGSGRDGFVRFFEPIGGMTLHDLTRMRDIAFFPPKWTGANLAQENLAKWQGQGSRGAALYFLHRPEKIVVCDFYMGVINVAPWLPAGHPMQGKPLDHVYRYLIGKYLRPRPAVEAACAAFFTANLRGAPFVAVHMRGSDKGLEDPELKATTEAYFPAIAAVDPSWRIFLLTDDAQLHHQVKSVFGERVVSTPCQRTSTTTGVHLMSDVDRVQAGLEVMIDAYLALRADRFIGNGRSSVSAMIALMKDWGDGNCTIFGQSQMLERNLSLYVSR
jgi:hypothetical protein